MNSAAIVAVIVPIALGCIGLLVSIIRDARKQGEIDVEE